MVMSSDQNLVNEYEPVGAVLVVGAGIGGMQAALDLAEAGFKVYLVERSPAIGGRMPQLDKTFPTNDCAMCILSPKLVEVGRHLNIEILTTSEVEDLRGEPGNFQVKIRRHPRYVDLQKCTGCGDCAAACPVARPDEFNGSLSDRRAIYKPYPQAIPNAYAIEKAGIAPCRGACPIGQRVQGYVALVREGRFADAYRTILEENPFPSVCGRVCDHRCEQSCTRGLTDAPVNIMGIKRFVADWQLARPSSEQEMLEAENPPDIQPGFSVPVKKVAIIGSGPAGLTCARDLKRSGYAVTVFEALPEPGGMMTCGIPEYRLPQLRVKKEIEAILAEGIELRLNTRVEDAPGLLSEGFSAVFVAVGAHLGVRLPIPGAELPAVTTATEFLREISLYRRQVDDLDSSDTVKRPDVAGERVLVLGGGNVAIDTAMSAVRLGASWVGMACLESRERMPAHEWEVRDAAEEGIEIYPSRTFKEITSSEDRVSGVRCCQVNFRGFIDGRPDFDELPGTEEIIPADLVVFAIGQRPQLDCLRGQVAMLRGRYPQVDPETLATSVAGIYCGGDALTGTAFVVDAIAAGHKAASAIDHYLQGNPPQTSPPRSPSPGAKNHAPGEGEDRLMDLVSPLLKPEEARRRVAEERVLQKKRVELIPRPAGVRKRDFGEIYSGLSEENAREEAGRCLSCGICSECLQCVYTCRAGAIDHDQGEVEIELQVGAVILAPGVEPLPGNIRPEYGYGIYPNVVTSLEFERMLSASGPFGGAIQRPSDQSHPRKIAWIQCVGSRDTSCGQGYCSSVCCMYSAKEAVIAREHDPRIEPTIFYIDIRAFGKGFDDYIERAEREQGVRYIRSMVSTVKEIPGSRSLRLSYATFDENGRPAAHEEEYELVVLSTGLKPSQEARQAALRLGVELNEWGFAEAPACCPAQTSRPGVFAVGAFSEPKDIPETVIEASCAAAQASALLAAVRGTLTRQAVYPAERETGEEAPRVGVFICHCGINIGGVVDVAEVVESAQRLPGVVYAERNLYTCSQDTQRNIAATIEEKGLNRVVVASCTPRTHEPLFQDTLRQAGLNPHLFEMANIREQDAWVHRAGPQEATEKAKGLVGMAVAKALRLRPVQRGSLEVERRALVIGGGLAGMTAALSIAAQGFPVTLVERSAQLGGNLQHVRIGLDGKSSPQQLLAEMIERVRQDPRISLLLETEVVQVSGFVGQYRTLLQARDGTRSELVHGAIVVATGAREIRPECYGYGLIPGVITQREFEHSLSLATQPCFRPNEEDRAGCDYQSLKSIVMIQCAGSRDADHPYCSRICCTQAIKNALAVKRLNPRAEVTILYRDLRSYGFRERLYRQARRAGILFLPFDPNLPPEVRQVDGHLVVTVKAFPEGRVVTLGADRVVLSAGIEAEPGNEALSRILKLPLNAQGFFLEAHAKLRPVDFATEGIYLCGLAHSPRNIEETIAQAQAAAVRAVSLLAKGEITATPVIATVNPRLCSACGLCVEVCPYGARRLLPGQTWAEVVEVLCQGCGACIAVCPNKASQQKGFEVLQVMDMIDAALL